MTTATETVEQELREYAKTQGGTRIAKTIAALRRSDRDRVPQFWPGSAAVQHVGVWNAYKGDEELTAMFSAEKYAAMRAVLGWVAIDGYPMQAGAWLVLNGSVVDPAGAGRDCLGFLGLELRAVEAARWTPTNRAEVANTREVGGFRL
jgi:hypothetical protein